jgi:hypothetical protein
MEYLRKNPDYRRLAMPASKARRAAGRSLSLLEDPRLDARDRHPAWFPDHDTVVKLYSERTLERLNHWEKTSHALVLYASEDKTLRGVGNFLSDPAWPFELTLHVMMAKKQLIDVNHRS